MRQDLKGILVVVSSKKLFAIVTCEQEKHKTQKEKGGKGASWPLLPRRCLARLRIGRRVIHGRGGCAALASGKCADWEGVVTCHYVTCHSKRECSISQVAGAGRILVLHYSSQYSAQHTNGREIALCSGAPHALTMRYRFEDFAECFPTYVEEDRNGASATFNSIADYIEAQNFVRSVYIYINASQA